MALCGEMAGDPANAGLLIGLGLTELSMAPGNLARVKKRIRSLEFGATRQLADTVMLQTDPDRVAEILAAERSGRRGDVVARYGRETALARGAGALAELRPEPPPA